MLIVTSVEHNKRKLSLEKIDNEYLITLKTNGEKTNLAKSTSLETSIKLFDFILLKEFKIVKN